MSLELLHRIEQNSNAAAARQRELVPVGPFRALLDRGTDVLWLNYTVPVAPLEDPLAIWQALGELRRVLEAQGRRLRFEFNGGLWPDLPGLLEQTGLRLQAWHPVMTCTLADLRAAQAQGVQVSVLDRDAAPARLRPWLAIRDKIFGRDTPSVSDQETEAFRRDLDQGRLRCALAELDGEPAGVGCTVPIDGVAELGGVATESSFRRRGVAATLCSYLALDHFASGGKPVWLSAGDEVAQAVYEGVGFRVIGERQNYVDRPA